MRAIRARILQIESTQPLQWQYLDDGVIIIESGQISGVIEAGQAGRDGFDLDICEDKRAQ